MLSKKRAIEWLKRFMEILISPEIALLLAVLAVLMNLYLICN